MPIKVNDQGFVYDSSPTPAWIPPINLKQFEIFMNYHRYLLVEGPRKSGKSLGIVHKVIKHAFEVNYAMVAIVTKTLKNSKAAGVWVHLTRFLDIWAAECPGFAIVEGPKVTGDSKMTYVKIRNKFGGVSEIQCHSLDSPKEVEAKFKGPAYSMFWLSEFDQFCDENAFDIICDALRMTPLVPYEDHQIICDCNPPDSGPNNWIHDKWFKFGGLERKDVPEKERAFWSGLHRLKVMIDDNPQLHPLEREELDSRYRKRPNLYKRFVLGEWVQDIVDGHFSDSWDESVHVKGNIDCHPSERTIIVPSSVCHTLLCGWDIGEKHHSFHILEKESHQVETKDVETGKMRLSSLVSFSVLDELVSIKRKKDEKPMSIREFVEKILEKMAFWQKVTKENGGSAIRFRHWSDTSAWEERSSSESTDAAIVYEASMGQIVLEKAPKYANSNKDKVELVTQLLLGNRFFVSAQLKYTRAMMAAVKKGTTKEEYVAKNEHKHPFDSMTYPILAEAPMDMLRSIQRPRERGSPTIFAASI